jgi:hypothetical protein
MAVSIHFQSSKGLQSKVLDLAHIPSPHTGKNIKRILNINGLHRTETFQTFCDNASSMKQAFRVSIWEDEAIKFHEEEEEVESGSDSIDEVQDINADFKDIFQEYR